MPSNQMQALLECGCSCTSGCIGCCVPVDEGTNAPQEIPFTISAPSCPELDGYSGIFDPVAPPTSQELLLCGVCGIYAARAVTPDVDGAFYNPPAPCVLISPGCTFGPWRFGLHCETPLGLSDNAALESCCRRLRLSWAREAGGGGTPEVDTFYTDPISCECNPLMAIFSIADLIPQSWTSPGIFCSIDGCFPIACDLSGATLII
jgi:hypothetical protein